MIQKIENYSYIYFWGKEITYYTAGCYSFGERRLICTILPKLEWSYVLKFILL